MPDRNNAVLSEPAGATNLFFGFSFEQRWRIQASRFPVGRFASAIEFSLNDGRAFRPAALHQSNGVPRQIVGGAGQEFRMPGSGGDVGGGLSRRIADRGVGAELEQKPDELRIPARRGNVKRCLAGSSIGPL